MPEFKGFGVAPKSEPLMGIVSQPEVHSEPKEQVAFKEPNEDDLLQEEIERQAVLRRAQSTKFATGDPVRDLHNYRVFRKAIDSLMGLVE